MPLVYLASAKQSEETVHALKPVTAVAPSLPLQQVFLVHGVLWKGPACLSAKVLPDGGISCCLTWSIFLECCTEGRSASFQVLSPDSQPAEIQPRLFYYYHLQV